MKKEESQKIILFLIILFGICYAYYSYLFVPEWSEIQKSNSQLHERQGYYQRLLAYSANASEIAKEIKTVEAQQNQLISQTTTKLDKPQLLVYLYNLAKHNQVESDKVVFGQPQDKGTYKELPLTFTFSGKVNEVLSMIQNLQFTGTQRFAIQSTKLTDKQGILQVELKMTIYSPVLASKGNTVEPKPPYMIYPFGTATIDDVFKSTFLAPIEMKPDIGEQIQAITGDDI
jgi:type IV pilus assembly protein PilO